MLTKKLQVRLRKGYVYATEQSGLEMTVAVAKHSDVPNLSCLIRTIGDVQISITGIAEDVVLSAEIMYSGSAEDFKFINSYQLESEDYHNVKLYRIVRDSSVIIKAFTDYDRALHEYASMINYEFGNELHKFNLQVFESEV